jgi:hypothetical protein
MTHTGAGRPVQSEHGRPSLRKADHPAAVVGLGKRRPATALSPLGSDYIDSTLKRFWPLMRTPTAWVILGRPQIWTPRSAGPRLADFN